jgi:hypothetical protein
MFTPKMAIALRTMNLLRKGGMTGWVCEHCLQHNHGIHPKTLNALEQNGIIHRRVDSKYAGDCGPRMCRLRGRTLAIIEAVRA